MSYGPLRESGRGGGREWPSGDYAPRVGKRGGERERERERERVRNCSLLLVELRVVVLQYLNLPGEGASFT